MSSDEPKAWETLGGPTTERGMVLTTWLVSYGVLTRADAGEFWSGLGFPDCYVLDLAARSLRRHT